MYKFMSLAAVSAAWNTRKGAAIGFATIAAKAGEQVRRARGQAGCTREAARVTLLGLAPAAGVRCVRALQLKPHLPRLVPKLYRYLFDPSPKVNAAMAAIWKALVPDRAKALDEHLGAILVELVRQRHVPRGKGGERAHQRRGRHALHLGERARPQLASMTHRQWRIREAR